MAKGRNDDDKPPVDTSKIKSAVTRLKNQNAKLKKDLELAIRAVEDLQRALPYGPSCGGKMPPYGPSCRKPK